MTRLFKLLWLVAVIVLTTNANAMADTPLKTIRVGFFQFDGYHKCDQLPGGKIHRSGYGYEVLQMLLPYTNWEYEYVGYEKGWSVMLPMLKNGEIDILTSAVKIPEKERFFDFSSRSIGFSSVIMTVKAGRTRFLPHDYPNWNGIKVGVLLDNSKNKRFAQFAQEKKFTYQEFVYTSIDEMHDALQGGKIDAVVTGSLRRLRNEWLYEELDVQPFYIIVKKGNEKLLSKINSALEKLQKDYPGFTNELQMKYYDHATAGGDEISLSLEERAFYNKCKCTEQRFRILVNPDRFPFSYFENGQFKGIMKTLLDTIETRSGIELDPVFCKDRDEYHELLQRRECDLVLDMQHDFSKAEQLGYILTSSYLSAVVSRISRKDYFGEAKLCAVVKNSNMADIIGSDQSHARQICAYPTLQAVIDAVKNGQTDSGFIFSSTAESAILNDQSGTLTLYPSGYVVHYAIGIKKELDRSLIGIISKTVRSLTEDEIQQILISSNLRQKPKPTFRAIVAEYPMTVFFSMTALALVLGSTLVVVRIFHRRSIRAATELAKTSRMWNLLINSLPIHIFAKEIDKDSRFVFNNKARADFFGLDLAQMELMTDYDFLPHDVAAQRHKIDHELCAAGEGKNECFLNVKGADGAYHHLYSVLIPFADSDGTKLILGCSVDQTELEEVRKQVIESSEWFHKTLISIGDAVLATDKEGNITLLNPVAEKMLGITAAECKGKKHTDFFRIVSYLDESELASPVDHCLATGEISSLTNHTDLISGNGTRYHIADSAAPIRGNNGEISGAILVFRDVTQEYDLRDKLQHNTVQLREALALTQQASAAKGVFLSQMSHEIRTPLNAIIGYLNIAQNCDNNPEKIQECLKKGINASTHLLSIINDILDITSIESGKLRIAHEDFDFKNLLTGIVSMFYNQAESKKIRFDLTLSEMTEEWLVGDSLRVNQVLLNLLSNAMKFTPGGGAVTLTVKQLGIVRNRVQLMLQVSDTGCGMSEDFLSRIFQPFEQQDASTARQFGGTGLGLSITKNLVTLMGGTIEIDSKENEGTTFTVNLSFEKSTRTHTVADVDFSRLRAIVADDQLEDREYIKMVLAKCGVKCDLVDSGEAAIRQIQRRMESRHPYDLCLLDLRLPGIDGLETARQIHQLENSSALPVILITAYDVSAISSEAHDAGVNRIIQKPLFQSTFFDFLMTNYYNLDKKKDIQKAQDSLKGLKIMLVEDNQMNMDISTQYLERAGMKIVSAWNGKEAVDVFTQSAPGAFQAILMDIQMPIMDGYDATKAIRSSKHPEAKTIPIIAMTANAFNEDVVKALKAGMNDHISKPVFYDRLFDALSKLAKKDS